MWVEVPQEISLLLKILQDLVCVARTGPKPRAHELSGRLLRVRISEVNYASMNFFLSGAIRLTLCTQEQLAELLMPEPPPAQTTASRDMEAAQGGDTPCGPHVLTNSEPGTQHSERTAN